MTTVVNTLERLAVLVVAVVSVVFMYGMLSMAWAEEPKCFADADFDSCFTDYYKATSPWILWVKVGSRPIDAKNWGVFITKEQCEYIAKLVTLDIRKTDKTSHLEINCELRE